MFVLENKHKQNINDTQMCTQIYGTIFVHDFKVTVIIKVGHNDKYNDILKYVYRLKKQPVYC